MTPSDGPLTQCAQPGCRQLIRGAAKCAEHTRKTPEERQLSTAKHYGRAHKRRRIYVFQRDSWTCKQCGWKPELVAIAEKFGIALPATERILEDLRVAYHDRRTHLHCDHVYDVDVRPDLADNVDYQQTLCSVCHGEKTRQEAER